MLGAILAEGLATWLIQQLFWFGTRLGLPLWHDDPAVEASVQIAAKIMACAAVVAVVLRRARQPWSGLGRAGFAPGFLPVAFLPIIAGVVIFLSELDNILRAVVGERGLDSWDIAPSIGRLVTGSWQGVVLAVVVAPLTEELLFRGVILRGFLGRWKPWSAIATTALLFAGMHINPAQMPVAFLLGLVLGWVYVRTGSLGLCFLGHALNNAAAYFVGALPFEVDNFNHVPPAGNATFHPWWFDVVGLLLFTGGAWLLHRLAPAGERWQVPPAPEPPLLAPPLPRARGANDDCQPPLLANTQPSMSAELVQLVTSLAQRARAASLVLATAPTTLKNAALARLATLIDVSHQPLLAANARDLASPEATDLGAASRDRLTLTELRLQQLAEAVRAVIALPDPVGEVLEEINRPNGLRIRKLRVPIGVIGIIYEARPNVTVDCAILCLKSGNASILRGGKECFHTNTALAALIQQALGEAGLPADAVQLIPTTERAALNTLLKLDALVHCIIPRGGESLIRYVAENSTIPVIKHYKGVCFVYVDAAADLMMAEAITVNAKTSRPSVCNAAEQLLVHRAVADAFLPAAARALAAKNVELRCDAASGAILDRAAIPARPAAPADFTAEFLDYIMAIRVVDSLDAAIATINRDSSNHSDAIVTADEAAARRFLAEVDSATVYWNASTRFTDGYEFGYGAEIGISTDRLHARGPMGLRELCSHKFVIEGTGQVRE